MKPEQKINKFLNLSDQEKKEMIESASDIATKEQETIINEWKNETRTTSRHSRHVL